MNRNRLKHLNASIITLAKKQQDDDKNDVAAHEKVLNSLKHNRRAKFLFRCVGDVRRFYILSSKGFNYNARSKVVYNRANTSQKRFLFVPGNIRKSHTHTHTHSCLLLFDVRTEYVVLESACVCVCFSIINNPFNGNWRKLNFQLSIFYIIYSKED